jgi:hypothetical protein
LPFVVLHVGGVETLRRFHPERALRYKRVSAKLCVVNPMNTLYFGGNLKILLDYIRDETVDLVNLDPPSKSTGVSGWQTLLARAPTLELAICFNA